MAKQLNVNLAFTADTSQAKKQLEDLRKSLQDLTNNSLQKTGFQGTFNKEIQDALLTVGKLDNALKNALNTSTGRLDLSKLSSEFNKAGLSVEEIRQKMASLGPEGSQAFLKVANSIMLAQKPMKETNKLLDNMWTALKNTARWQLSSSMLHGFMGAIQGAYGYAQDLDKSLNSIRIVSGQSSEQMAELAEHANQAAQALSTSTLAYTDAALIYYQQGLDPEEVAARTETTLKMSNVTGESADAVSSYMTAIWNNFAEGSENLEYFADVITALGASTASSSEEIANGMQQFAAVANTVGLSYEYAASALATIVATTRQSESTVGNGLRTIFARFDSVKLGETLEDGVGLTKYTEALQKAGVNVLDQNGQLKEMDQILDEIGEKWEYMNTTQKTALAQTVGGVRQYANLIALFDNWSDFQENLQTAYGAEGSLQEQAEIYAESWEAARKRVQAAWQAIYQDLIDDKFFISLLNTITKGLQAIDKIIDSIGGLKGVLGTLGSVITFVFQDKLTQGISQGIRGVAQFTGLLAQQDEELREQTKRGLAATAKDLEYSGAGVEQARAIQSQIQQTELLKNAQDKLNEADLEHIKNLQQQQTILEQNAITAAQSYESLRDKVGNLENTIQSIAKIKGLGQDLAAAFLEELENAGNKLAEGLQKGLEKEPLLNSLTQEIVANKDYKDFGLKEANIKEIIIAYQERQKATEQMNAASDAARNAEEATEKAIKERTQSEAEEQEAIKATTAALKEKTKALEENQAQATKPTYQQQSAVTEAQNRVNKDKEAIGAIEGQIEKKQSDYQFVESQSANDERALALQRKELANITSELNSLEQQRQQLLAQLDRHQQQLDASTQKLNASTQESIISEREDTNEKEKNAQSAENVSRAIEDENNVRKQNTGATEEETRAVDKNTDAKKKNKDIGKIADNLSSGIMKAASVMSSITAQTAALDKLQEVWSDDSLSNLDKFKNSLGGASSILMQFGRTYSQFGGGKTGLIAATVVTGTSIAIKGLQIAYQKYYETTASGKLDAANKELEEQKKKANEAAAAYDRLTVAIENYKDTQEQLQDKDSNLNDVERQKLINETNAKIYEALENTENWQKIIGTLHFDDNGLIQLTEKQLKALQNDQYRVQLLEQQKQLQDEINQKALEQTAETEKYSGPQFITKRSGEVNGIQYSAVVNETESVLDSLVNNNITDLDTIKSFLAGEENGLKQLIEIFGEERATEVANWIQSLSESDQQLLEKYLQESASRFNQVSLKEQENARLGMGSQLNDYDEQSQNKLIKAYNELDDDTQLSITSKMTEEGASLIKILEEAGIKIDEFHLKLKELNEDDEHHIKVNINADDLVNFKGKTEDLEVEVKQLSEFLQENYDDYENLSSHLAECSAEADKVAYSLLRFDDAMQDVADNYDNWKAALNSKDLVAINNAVQDLEKTYGNLLDIDGSQLSDDFLKSSENCDRLNTILYGTEEQALAAYNELSNLATIDLMSNLNPELGMAKINDMLNAVTSAVNEIENELGRPIAVGENINSAPLESALNQIIAACATTEAEAANILSSLGYEAEFENVPVESTDTKTVTGYTGEVETIDRKWTDAGFTPDGQPTERTGSATAASVKYTVSEPQTITDTKVSNVGALRIKAGSLHKASGGEIKIKNSPARQTARDTKSKGGGSGGNKGSTPKEKKKTVKEHKEPKKEEDRYHDLKERIDDVNTALNRMGKTKDRVFGKAKLKYMDLELARMKDQIALTKEYIKEAQNYLKIDRAALEGIKKGAAFDENGMLTNYEEVLKNITEAYNNQLAQYNAAVDTFNASAQEDGDNAALEAEEKALAKAEKTFEENKKILKQYEDTYNLIQKQQEELIDQLNEYYDTLLENVDIKVKMKIDLEEDDKKLLEWMYKYIGDSADYAADKIANLSKQLQASKKELDIMRAGVEEIFKNHGMNIDVNNLDADDLVAGLRRYMEAEGLAGEMTEAEIEKIREYRDALMQYYDDMYDKFQQVNEVLRETSQEHADQLDREIEKYDILNKKIDYYRKIINLVGRTSLGLSKEEMEALDRASVEVAMDNLASATNAAEEFERRRVEALEGLQDAKASGDEDWIREAKKTYEEAEDLAVKYEQARLDAHLDAQEKINNSWENSWDLIEAEYKRQLGSLDNLLERYNLQKEVDHLYLDDFEKYHELNNSMKELQKSMNNTNNNKMLAKMADLQDDINAAMQAGVQISEVSAEIIARRVALLQAEAELMDAQNAKSAVRMTRDNEGNFSYTYTADQDQINDAEQSYGDKFYELMKFERDSQENYQTEMLQLRKDYIEALRAVDEAYMNDEFATREEYLEAKAQIEELYNEKMYFLHDELGLLFDEQARLYEDDWQDFEDFTGLKLAEQDDFVTEFEQTVVGRMTEGYQTLDGELETWLEVSQKAYGDSVVAGQLWQQQTDAAMTAAKLSIDNFTGQMLLDLQNIDKSSEETKNYIKDMVSGPEGMTKKFEEARQKALEFNQDFAKFNQEERDQIQHTVEELNEMIRKLAETGEAENDLANKSNITKTAIDNVAEAAQAAAGAFDAMAEAANKAADAANRAANAGKGTDEDNNKTNYNVGGAHIPGLMINREGGYQGKLSNSDRRWLTNISSAATGMYTGAWGNEGKLAILHEKELVLNRADTENMLDIVGTVRRIVASIGSGDFLNNLVDSINNHVSNINKPNGVLDQNVHIEASFPNVQSHSEIELALNNLINSASQFVNRK